MLAFLWLAAIDVLAIGDSVCNLKVNIEGQHRRQIPLKRCT